LSRNSAYAEFLSSNVEIFHSARLQSVIKEFSTAGNGRNDNAILPTKPDIRLGHWLTYLMKMDRNAGWRVLADNVNDYQRS
jgi:hypothetical protein